MTMFGDVELHYLQGGRRLARLATVGADGTPHVVPVSFSYNAAEDSIEVTGRDWAATKKYHDVRRSGRAAIVADDVPSPRGVPRGVEVCGTAEAIAEPEPLIRMRPERFVSWGLESDQIGERNARSTTEQPSRPSPLAGDSTV